MTETMRADALRIGTSAAVPGHTHGTEDVVADHGLLIPASLLDDDHPQYLRTDGGRVMTGNLQMGAKKITNLAAAAADGEAVNWTQYKAASMVAGNGLYGGGAVKDSPTLHVGGGRQMQVDADGISLPVNCTSITDWNDAIYDGWYMASSAANSPSSVGGWWYGFTICHNADWCTQMAFPFANTIPQNALMIRVKGSGTWFSWFRFNNYATAWDVLDNFLILRHGGDWSSTGVSRWAIGNKKDGSTAAPSAADTFRIQRYDTAGTYTGNLMTGTQAGVVNFPGGHTRMVEAMAAGSPVEADRAATVGIVDSMIRQALMNAGIVTPAALDDDTLTGLRIGEPTPDYDPSDNEPESEPPGVIDPSTLG